MSKTILTTSSACLCCRWAFSAMTLMRSALVILFAPEDQPRICVGTPLTLKTTYRICKRFLIAQLAPFYDGEDHFKGDQEDDDELEHRLALGLGQVDDHFDALLDDLHLIVEGAVARIHLEHGLELLMDLVELDR